MSEQEPEWGLSAFCVHRTHLPWSKAQGRELNAMRTWEGIIWYVAAIKKGLLTPFLSVFVLSGPLCFDENVQMKIRNKNVKT